MAGEQSTQLTPDQIRRDMEVTRAQIERTAEALGRKLQPRHLVNEFLNPFYEPPANPGSSLASRTVRNLRAGVARRLNDHPVPIAFIGAGIFWYVFIERPRTDRTATYEGRGSSLLRGRDRAALVDQSLDAGEGLYFDELDRQEFGERRVHMQDDMMKRDMTSGLSKDRNVNATGLDSKNIGGSRTSDSVTSRVGDTLNDMRDKAKEAGQAVSERISETAHQVKDSLADNLEKGREVVADRYEKSKHFVNRKLADSRETIKRGVETSRDSIKRGVDTSRRTFNETLDESPLLLGAAALGVGVLAGMLLPRTQREERWIGDKAQALKREIRETGNRLVEHTTEVASTTLKKAANEAVRSALGGTDASQDDSHAQNHSGNGKQDQMKRSEAGGIGVDRTESPRMGGDRIQSQPISQT